MQKQQTLRPFGARDKFGYMFGDFGNDFTFILSTSILMKFYTDVMGVSAAVVGTIMMLARFVDAVTDVTMGRICDNSKPTAAGKFKPWLLRMCVPVAIASFLMYAPGLASEAVAGWSSTVKTIYLVITYNAMAKYILDFTEKYNLSFPGWEPERMAKLDELFKAYADVDHEKLWANLKYFLEALMPTCEETGIKMAIHMDDPPWDIFGLPRLLINEENIDRFLKMVDHPCNCLTLCSGSLNADPSNNVADVVRKHCDRIAFAHIRNVKHFENGDFSEASHRDCDGDTGILEILKAYHDCGYEGYIRPDHGRHLWGEGPGTVRPGYGLYDRALGIMYVLGVWDMLDKLDGK